jgi:1,4-dihydroxy-2-naphthoyl-CoA hydrolase
MSLSIEKLNELCKDTLVQHLGIEFLELSDGKVLAKMPVDSRTMQTMRKLHGGASMALAETVGGVGSMCLVDNNEFAVLGIEISGSHVSNTSEAYVYALATIISRGKSTHVWEIRIQNSKGGLISLCRLTNRILLKKYLAG